MTYPAPSAVLQLLKPLTWFAPMWAFACGAVSAGVSTEGRWPAIIAGVFLAGPLVCATSQAVNDWFDRHVDAINEPGRPIPSGRIPGNWGFVIGLIWAALSLVVAWFIGPWVFAAAVVGLVFAWAYSAPPFRLKQNGWWGNTAVAICYEGLPWFTGAAIMAAALPDVRVLVVALLYSVGAHGIMTLNDYKAVEGDRALGIRSLPVQMGIDRSARFACAVMALPQIAVIGLLAHWEIPYFALAVAALLAAQFALMPRLLRDPEKEAPRYNATGTGLYVLGMLVTAFGVGGLPGGTQ